MKKLSFTFLFMIACVIGTNAQLASFTLDDFENGNVNFTTEVHVNPAASMDIAVVDNPVKDAVNGSNKVWEWKRYDTGDNQAWAGFWAVLTNEIPKGYHKIEVKYLRKNATSQLKLKCEGAVTKEMLPVANATKTNQWETLVFDIYANEIKNIKVIGLFPDFYTPIDVNAIVYVDDIKVIYDPSVVPPPPPTSIDFFDDSANDRFHDQSWSPKATAPSTLVLEHWEGPGKPDGDKFPVVTSPVKSGQNALKLQWKSVTGGAWSIMTASIGWKMNDLTQMTHLKFWVNSPANLSKGVLPKISFESGSGNPNRTGRVALSAYAPDLTANTWTEVSIPLADIWAANPDFKAIDVIKGLFFEQDATDGVEHTLYLDEIKFINDAPPPSIVFFDNSANDRFHDQSWSPKATAPSTLALEHWEGPGKPDGDKFPVVTSPVKDGTNALKLQWKSMAGGDWSILLASLGWKLHDLTEMTHLKFWVNATANLSKSALPKISFESGSGNPNRTGKVSLSAYSADLAANTWTEISVPLANVWAANPNFTAKDVVKGIFFEQDATDGVEHTLYLDEFKFVKEPTGLSNLQINTIRVNYSAGMLSVGDYVGNIRVFSIAGSLIANRKVEAGAMQILLPKGVYIVQTDEGVGKLLVK